MNVYGFPQTPNPYVFQRNIIKMHMVNILNALFFHNKMVLRNLLQNTSGNRPPNNTIITNLVNLSFI